MIFSLKWFREKAKEILGHDDISLTLKSSGKVEITVYNTENYKFNKFKKIIEDNDLIGVEVIVRKIVDIMKVKITNEGLNTHKVKVLVDGIDITRNLTDINVNIKAGEIPTLKLEFVPDEMQIDGDYEVIKNFLKRKIICMLKMKK
ncbi:hypothetical protein [Clostridium butyricum]